VNATLTSSQSKKRVVSPATHARLGYAWRKGRLYRYSANEELIVRLWPNTRIWTKRRCSDGLDAKCPDLSLSSWRRIVRRNLPLRGDSHLERMLLDLDHRARVLQAALASVPGEVMEVVVRFRHRQFAMLSLLSHCPGSGDLVRSSPALAFLIADAETLVDITMSKTRASGMVRLRQRDALEALGFPGTESAARILRRVPVRSVSRENLHAVRRLLHRRDAGRFLRQLPRINSGVIAILSCGALLQDLQMSLLHEVSNRPAEDRVATTHQKLMDAEIQGALFGRRPAIHRLCSIAALDLHLLELARAIRQAAPSSHRSRNFPDPPFPGRENIRPLSSVAELTGAAKRLQNCCTSYRTRIAKRYTYLYLVTTTVPDQGSSELTMFSVVKRRQRWRLDEIEGERGRRLNPAALAEIESWCRDNRVPTSRWSVLHRGLAG